MGNRNFEMSLPDSKYDKTVIVVVGLYKKHNSIGNKDYNNDTTFKLTNLFQEFGNVGVINIEGHSGCKPCFLGFPLLYDVNNELVDGICGHKICKPAIWKVIWSLKVDRLLRLWKDKDWKEEYLKFPMVKPERIKKLELNPTNSLFYNKDVVVSFADTKTICMEGEVNLREDSIASQIKDIEQHNVKLIYMIKNGHIEQEHKKYEHLIDLKIDIKDIEADKTKKIIEERYNLK